MAGKFEKGDVLFVHVVQNADRAGLLVGKTDDFASRTAELALQRLHSLDRRVEMPLKKALEDFHEIFGVNNAVPLPSQR